MALLLDLLGQHLGPQTVQQLSEQLGTRPDATQQAITAALPALIGGLARNADSEGGAQALASALEKDHDGTLLDNLGGMLAGGGGAEAFGTISRLLGGKAATSGGLGGLLGAAGSMLGGAQTPAGLDARALDGDGILRHLLGDRREAVERGVGKAAGFDLGTAKRLLTLLAPLVMSALGKLKQQQGLDASGLAHVLTRERTALEAQTPGPAQGGLLSLLDADDDGQVADDVAKIGQALAGSGALGKLFGK